MYTDHIDAIALPDLPRTIRGDFGILTTYQKIYWLIINGIVPAERAENGRWFVNSTDLPKIVNALRVKSASLNHLST